MLADTCRISDVDVAAVANLHAANAARSTSRRSTGSSPTSTRPFYGGINTALRIADYLHRNHGVQNRFVVWGSGPDFFVRSAIAAAFPSLADSEISFFDGPDSASLELVPPADASIATLWLTAYAVARAQNTKRKFYLVQDFEPMFYPASTSYALAEETYRLGLYGLCNTENLRQIYADEYGGKGMSFMPAIDPSVFHAARPAVPFRRRADHRLRLRAARPLAQLLGARVACAARAEGAARRRRADRHRRLVGHRSRCR